MTKFSDQKEISNTRVHDLKYFILGGSVAGRIDANIQVGFVDCKGINGNSQVFCVVSLGGFLRMLYGYFNIKGIKTHNASGILMAQLFGSLKEIIDSLRITPCYNNALVLAWNIKSTIGDYNWCAGCILH